MTDTAPRVRVRVQAWGATKAELDDALRRATQGWGRVRWEFADPQQTVGGACPINARDPKAIAAASDYGWAYAVYPER